MELSKRFVCVDDFERGARAKLPKYASDFYNSGANDEKTLKENVEAFRRLKIRPRRFTCNRTVDMSTSIFGKKISMPICIAPTGFQRMAHPDGELATARACRDMDTCMGLSGWSNSDLDEVSSICQTAPLWLQMSVYNDKSLVLNLIHAAEKAGCQGLVITADSPVVGKRLSDIRNDFELPSHLHLPIFEKYCPKLTLERKKDSDLYSFDDSDSLASWDYVDFIKSHTSLAVIVKGIVTGIDAREALDHGVDAIYVSNHGGRQLDSVPATIEALPEVVRAVQGKVDVFFDGGIRTGTDVFKALALGAKAVFVGRPVVWGLAVNGCEGAKSVLQLLKDELETTMYLAGTSTLQDISKSQVVHESYYHKL